MGPDASEPASPVRKTVDSGREKIETDLGILYYEFWCYAIEGAIQHLRQVLGPTKLAEFDNSGTGNPLATVVEISTPHILPGDSTGREGVQPDDKQGTDTCDGMKRNYRTRAGHVTQDLPVVSGPSSSRTTSDSSTRSTDAAAVLPPAREGWGGRIVGRERRKTGRGKGSVESSISSILAVHLLAAEGGVWRNGKSESSPRLFRGGGRLRKLHRNQLNVGSLWNRLSGRDAEVGDDKEMKVLRSVRPQHKTNLIDQIPQQLVQKDHSTEQCAVSTSVDKRLGKGGSDDVLVPSRIHFEHLHYVNTNDTTHTDLPSTSQQIYSVGLTAQSPQTAGPQIKLIEPRAGSYCVSSDTSPEFHYVRASSVVIDNTTAAPPGRVVCSGTSMTTNATATSSESNEQAIGGPSLSHELQSYIDFADTLPALLLPPPVLPPQDAAVTQVSSQCATTTSVTTKTSSDSTDGRGEAGLDTGATVIHYSVDHILATTESSASLAGCRHSVSIATNTGPVTAVGKDSIGHNNACVLDSVRSLKAKKLTLEAERVRQQEVSQHQYDSSCHGTSANGKGRSESRSAATSLPSNKHNTAKDRKREMLAMLVGDDSEDNGIDEPPIRGDVNGKQPTDRKREMLAMLVGEKEDEFEQQISIRRHKPSDTIDTTATAAAVKPRVAATVTIGPVWQRVSNTDDTKQGGPGRTGDGFER
eukprot:GHVQ01035803.1.p1 GENE.GHVQ01035803.1~~GHVQ01035803.1.p1  ORF type:complete len:747 (+),score=125.34 GHVQ01035803.1:148-2241(+)